MVAHAIAGSDLWSVEPEPQRAAKEGIAESVCKAFGQAVFHQEKGEVLTLLGLPARDTLVRFSRDDYGVVSLFTTLLRLSDEDVLRVLTCVMAETLAAGTGVVEAIGNHLSVNMGDYWEPDDVFLELVRDKAVISAILREVAGKRVADGNVTATGKAKKQIIRDYLSGENGRECVEGWLPRYMTFPFRAYTKNGGIGIAAAWDRVKRLLKAA